jgi:2-haloacid dehalogenase
MIAKKAPRALIFDVFGTLVDWRTSIAREAQAILGGRGIVVDWLGFADAWRAKYQPSMEEIRAGRIGYTKLDDLHRRNLDQVLAEFSLEAVDEAARAHLNHAWRRLDAWPDVNAGLARLRARFLLAPCSNGNFSLMVGLARHNDWHWDAILGAEIARDYKPKPIVYLAAAAAFDCAPEEVVMVAAHSYDLKSAAEAGLRTAFVARPDEHGPGTGERAPIVPVDYVVADLAELPTAIPA